MRQRIKNKLYFSRFLQAFKHLTIQLQTIGGIER